MRAWRRAVITAVAAGAFALAAAGAQAATFTSAGGIVINDGSCVDDYGSATPYPSTIDVAGLTGPITDVDVTLTGLSHGWLSDIRVLLVGPGGETTLLLHEAGGSSSVTDVTLTLDDEAAAGVPDEAPVSGSYRPTWAEVGCGSISASTSLPAPAPPGPYGSTLGTFDGTDPNGSWSLYVVDKSLETAGDIDGWSLDIETEEAPATGPVSCADAAVEPLGCWRLGEASGTTAADASGNGNTGTYFGGPALGQPGVFAPDTAARFDGVDDHVRVPHKPGLNFASTFTAEAWIKRTSATKSHQLFNKGDKSLQLVVMGGTGQVFLRKANVTTIAQTAGGVPADGEWHHVAATMDGPGTATIYVDGVADTVPVAPTQTLANNATQLILGGTATTAHHLDELALYGEALGADTIAEHAGTGGPAPVNQPPVVASPASSATQTGTNPVAVDPDLTVTDPDSPLLTGATITILDPLSSDLLSFTDNDPGDGITISVASTETTLQLTGPGTPAQYQAALRAVAYSTWVSGVRTIRFTVTDAEGATSAPLDRQVSTIFL